jgi:hypothetical protein
MWSSEILKSVLFEYWRCIVAETGTPELNASSHTFVGKVGGATIHIQYCQVRLLGAFQLSDEDSASVLGVLTWIL